MNEFFLGAESEKKGEVLFSSYPETGVPSRPDSTLHTVGALISLGWAEFNPKPATTWSGARSEVGTGAPHLAVSACPETHSHGIGQVAAAPAPASTLGTAWSLRRDAGAIQPACQCNNARSPQSQHRAEGPNRVNLQTRVQGAAHNPGALTQDPCLPPQAPGRPEISGTPPPIPAYRGRRVLLIHRPLRARTLALRPPPPHTSGSPPFLRSPRPASHHHPRLIPDGLGRQALVRANRRAQTGSGAVR